MRRLLLIGGGAQSAAVQKILTEVVLVPVVLPAPEEYVAKGAAIQAVATLSGSFPCWPAALTELPASTQQPQIIEQHRAAKAGLGYDVDALAPE